MALYLTPAGDPTFHFVVGESRVGRHEDAGLLVASSSPSSNKPGLDGEIFLNFGTTNDRTISRSHAVIIVEPLENVSSNSCKDKGHVLRHYARSFVY